MTRFTDRLRLEPVGPGHAHDLWVVHSDDEVVRWYDGWKPSFEEAQKQADLMHHGWHELGVHKWMAYDRESGELVSFTPSRRASAAHDVFVANAICTASRRNSSGYLDGRPIRTPFLATAKMKWPHHRVNSSGDVSSAISGEVRSRR